jgi:hypothetical protein
MFIVCPKCSKDDAIEKLSSVASSGEASTYGSSSTEAVLARKLSPPQEPKRPGESCAVYVFLALGLWGLALVLIVVGIFLFVVAAIDSSPEFGRFVALVALGPGSIIIGIAMIPGGILLLTRTQRAAKARYGEKKPAWQKATVIYDRSYYCFRDDIVFDPETGRTADPSRFHSFLYVGQD